MEQWITGPRISKNNNYNIIRMLCATVVIYGHMYTLIGSVPPGMYGSTVHTLGFKMLMVLSGYMVAQSCIYDGSAGRFFLKRVSRLLPALFVCITISTIVIGPIFTTLDVKEYFANKATWEYWGYNILLNIRFGLPGVFESNPYPAAVNGSLWALPIEAGLYVILFVLLFVLARFKFRKLIISVLTVLISVVCLCRSVFFSELVLPIWGTDWMKALELCPFFFMGVLYAVTELKRYCNLQVAFLIVLLSIFFRCNNGILYEALLIALLPYVIISFGECAEPVFSGFLKHIDISYGMYLWGFVVQQLVIKVLLVDKQCVLNINILFAICYAASIVLGILSWKLVEEPVAKVVKRLCVK